MIIRARSTWLGALGSGLIGALAVTALNEWGRKRFSRAPRLDRLGERALSRGMKAIGLRPPRGRSLRRAALVGDLISNTLFFVMAAAARPHGVKRALKLGSLAGLGALFLPPRLGIGRSPEKLPRETQAMTLGWYTAGALASTAASRGFGVIGL